MAFPVAAANVAGAPTRTGLILSIGLSSNKNLAVEVQRMSTASTWQTRDILPGVALSQTHNAWTDILPLDQKKYWYRARNTFPGTWPSAWSSAGWSRPVVLSNNTPPPLALTGKGVGMSFFVQNPEDTIKIGTAEASTYITKRLTLSFADFLSVAGTPSYAPGSYAGVTGALANGQFQAAAPLPPGCTIRKVGHTGYRTVAGVTNYSELFNNGVSIKASPNSTVSATYNIGTVTSTAFAHVVTSTQILYILVTIINSATGSLGGVFRSVYLDYSMPSYDKAV